jgi:hypothetical protein
VTLNGQQQQFFHKIGAGWAGCGPLRRDEVEQAIREYWETALHSLIFLNWEIKKQRDHPENEAVLKEFVDLLEEIGLVTG